MVVKFGEEGDESQDGHRNARPQVPLQHILGIPAGLPQKITGQHGLHAGDESQPEQEGDGGIVTPQGPGEAFQQNRSDEHTDGQMQDERVEFPSEIQDSRKWCALRKFDEGSREGGGKKRKKNDGRDFLGAGAEEA